MCSRLPVCTNSYECVCSFLFLLLVAGSTVVHICALRQCGALWFPAPRLLIFFFLLSFIVLYSLSHSLPLPSSPFYQPSFVYSIEDVWLNILRPAESSWFSNFSCPLCQRKTKACAKYIWKRSLNLSELTLYFPSFLVSITPPSSSLSPSFSLCSPTPLLKFESKDLSNFGHEIFFFCFVFVLLFQRLASAKAHTSRFVSANLPCNKFKNRLVNIMPYETTRVCLQPIRGVEGSDYINASFIDGYRSERSYLNYYSLCFLFSI